MKSFEQQTYYELLDLPPSATEADIRDAHARALEMYAPDSVAVYALEDPSRLEALRARITEAVEFLTDAELRREYDASLGLPQRERVAALQAAAAGDTAAPPRPELGRGAASRLFARVASPQPGFSISYVALSPVPLFAPAGFVSPEPAAEAEPARAEHVATTEPVRVEAPVRVDAPLRAEPAVTAEPVRAEPSVTAEPLRVEVPGAKPEAAASPNDSLASTEPAPARAAEAQAEPAADSALALVPARPRELPRDEQRPRVPEIPADAEFNGELLRRVREARGLTLRVLADRTKIGTRHLENVEADRYDALPTSVYLRGILMNLARELGLDPLRVSKSYLALASATKNR